MSSTEIVHGTSTTPQPGFSGGSNDHPASYAMQAQALSIPAAVSVGASDPCATETDDKRFTTSYGMVVWPTLPGLSSSSSPPPSSAPVPAPGTQMSSAPADLVHHHSPSEARAAPRTAQTLLPGTMATIANHSTDVVSGGGGGPLQYSSSSSTMLLRAACDACHRMKRKCDGKQPCARCERRGRECLYSYKQKSGPPKGSKRKLIEEEDDLPENRPSKPTLRYHLGGTAGNAGEGNFAPTTAGPAVQPVVAAAPVVATWPGSSRSSDNSSNKGINPTDYDGGGDSGDPSAGDYKSHPASSSSASIESAGQFPQAPAQQFVHMPVQSPMPPHTQQCSPAPAPTPPAPVPAMAPAPPSPLRPSPEARAAAAAAVAASRMNALTPVAPTLATASLQYMLQPPPAAGGVVVGQGTAASLAPHPQYGTVYHHQYPPEVYAVYLAELRQRSCGSSGNIGSNVGSIISSSSSRSSGNGNKTSGNITSSGSNNTVNVPSNNNDAAPAASALTAACTTAAHAPLVSGPQEGIPALATAAAAEAAHAVAHATAVSPHAGTVAASNGGPTATTQADTTTGWFPPPVSAMSAGHLLPGIGGDWAGNKGSAATSSGNDGTGGGGGVEPDAAAAGHVAKMPERGGGGGESGGYYAGKAAAAAASSAALAAAVAAAIARSSPMVEEESCKTIDALTCSMAPSDGGRSHSELPIPLSPVKNNNFSLTAPNIGGGGGGDGDGRAGEVSPKLADAQAAAASAAAASAAAASAAAASALAASSSEREENELAAASLLLYGARGQGGTATCTGSTGAVGDGKVDEGQENNFQQQQQQQQEQQQQQQQQQQSSSLTT